MSTDREVRLVGCFAELGYAGAPSIVSARGRGHWENKSAVTAYLRAGEIMLASPGIVRDMFTPGQVAGSKSVLTDGRFAWFDALAYFVDQYDVELPPEFVEHIVHHRYQIPTGLNVVGLKLRR